MHVTLQRARQHSRGRFLTGAALNLVGAGLLLGLATSSALTAQRTDADTLITGSLPATAADVPLELRIEITRPGLEGIRLAGRLSEDGGLITKPVTWKLVRTLGTGARAATDEATDELILQSRREHTSAYALASRAFEALPDAVRAVHAATGQTQFPISLSLAREPEKEIEQWMQMVRGARERAEASAE